MNTVKQIPTNEKHSSDNILLGLSKVSQALQSTKSLGDVYLEFGESIHELGFEATILSLHKSGKYLTTKYQTRKTERMERFSNKIGFSINDYRIPIRRNSILDQVLNSGRIIFLESRTEIFLEIFPQGIRSLIKRLVQKDSGEMQTIIAPLWFDEKVFGVIGVSGVDLSENEIPAIKIFAAQVANAIMNAHSYRKLQEQEEEKFRIMFESAPDAYYISDLKGKFLDGNKEAERLTGFRKEELIGNNFLKLNLLPKNQLPAAAALLAKNTLGKSTGPDEFTLIRKDGGKIDVEIVTHPVSIDGKSVVLGIARDITERKLADETLEESEERYRTTFENINDGIIRLNKFGKVLDINDRVTDISGFARDELVGKNFTKLGIFKRNDIQKLFKQFGKAINGDVRDIWEWEFRNKNGTLVHIEVSPRLIRKNGKIEGIVAVLRDITERRRAENDLRASESRYRTLFKYSTDAISIHDGPNYIDINDTWLKMFGYREDEVLGMTPFDFSPFLQPDGLASETKGIEYLEQVSEGEDLIFEWRHTRSDGSEFDVEVGMTLTNIDGEIVHISFLRDITERKKAEDQINRRLDELRILQEVSSICLVNVDEYETISQVTKAIGKRLFPNHFGVMLLDEKQDVLRIHNSYQGISPEDFETLIALGEGITGLVAKTNTPKRIDDMSKSAEIIALTKNSRSELCVPISLNGKVFGVINAESFELSAFTEADELLLTTVADQLALAIQKIRLYQSEKKRRFEVEIQHEISTDLANSIELQSVLEKILRNMQRHFEFNSGGILLQENGYLRIVATHGLENEDKIKNLHIPAESPLYQEMIKTKAAIILENAQNDDRFQSLGDIGEEIRGWMGVPLIDQGEVFGYVTFDSKTPGKFTDGMAQLAQMLVNQTSSAIAKAKLYKETQLGIKRLEAMHEIDQIITASVDLSFSTEQIMQIIVSELEIDAANLTIYDPTSLMFNPINSVGFENKSLDNQNHHFGNGLQTRIIMNRETVFLQGEAELKSLFGSSSNLNLEGFKAYVGVPLIAKGVTKGVLELYQTNPLHKDSKWEGYLQTMATQLAIAIDNTQMFENLQKSHEELTLSYETTIEGWAKALELRDMETEGHSRRVVELTQELAQRMGVEGQEIAHIRRGALLHDIGKMAIPDAIIQKPGKLTDEEWEIMRQHPTYAMEWLTSTEYLKPALDIPYCHHEKWDGSGYPQGLKGSQIPMAARIFAVVDVYDALRSNRPYRKAWSLKKTIQHIQDQSGKQFDPVVVEKFLKMLKNYPAK